MNFEKYVRNDNKNECIICFKTPNKIGKCDKCNNAFCCVKCIESLYEIDENIVCKCCNTDKKYDTRLFLKIKCPLCRYWDLEILNPKNLNRFSKSSITNMILKYNEKTIDRFNFEFRVNRNTEYEPNSIHTDTTSINSEDLLNELNEDGNPIYERNHDGEIFEINY